jgi:Uma2 family endonuclease
VLGELKADGSRIDSAGPPSVSSANASSRDPTREKTVTTNPMTVRMFAHASHGHTIGENRQMHMAVKTRRWTRADLERLPDDGNKYEVVRGELFVTPPPSTRHEELLHVIAGHLRRYVEPKLGQVHQGRSAVVFEESHAEPDILVRKRVLPLPEKWDEMPIPFLVVEILSKSTKLRDAKAKRLLYLDAGIAEYWIVDGETRSIRVVRKASDDVLTDTLRWHPTGATEPMVLDVAAMFREALG